MDGGHSQGKNTFRTNKEKIISMHEHHVKEHQRDQEQTNNRTEPQSIN